VFLLDFADGRDDLVIAARLHRQVEAHLVVAHARATVRDGARAERVRACERRVDDQVTVGHQQRVLALVALARHHERLDEAFPDRGAAVDGDVRGHAEFRGARFDGRALFRVDAAGVGEHGVDVPAALLQVGTQKEVSRPPEKARTMSFDAMGDRFLE
jgi:hypothetical protein